MVSEHFLGRNSEKMEGTLGRWQQLEKPMFSGEDPDAWIARVEEYFLKNRFSEQEKVMFIEEFLEGKAFQWFLWEDRRRPFVCWSAFKMNLLHRFRPTQILLSETNMEVRPQDEGMISDPHVSGGSSSQPDLQHQNRLTTLEKTRRDLESREADGTPSNFLRSGAISLRPKSIGTVLGMAEEEFDGSLNELKKEIRVTHESMMKGIEEFRKEVRKNFAQIRKIWKNTGDSWQRQK